MRLWSDLFTSRIFPLGSLLSDKSKIVFKMSISTIVFSFGYLVGLKFSLIITVGSLLSWFVFVPLINAVGGIVAGVDGVNIFAALSPEQIFRQYVRPIGIGAIAMAGVIGIIRSSSVIGSAFKLAISGIMGGKSKVDVQEERTQKDIKMPVIFVGILLTIIVLFLFLLYGVHITTSQAIIALLTIVIITFLFTTVAANAIAIVGTNPVSGMTLMTLIVSSFVLVNAGLSGPMGMASALVIGGVVCTALSVAGGFITDLKVGYWIGTTPIKQQMWKFLGVFVSAATVGLVIYILAQAYGFVQTPETPNPLVAPQANAMAAVIEPLMQPGAQINWMLYVVGAIISFLVYLLGISPLAFALGMFIPQELNTPLIVGGLIHHFMNKSSEDKELVNARVQRGTLISSGFIAGAALFGVVGALLLFFGFDMDMKVWSEGNLGGEWTALLAFAVILLYFIWDTRRAKV